MKKLLIILACILSTSISAQNNKSFFSDINYDFIIGLGSSVCDKHYDEGKLSITVALDARKPIYRFKNEKSSVYGLVGLRYFNKGGKTDNDFFSSFDNGVTLSSHHLLIPIHAGYNYQFKRCSLYFDIGPYIGIKIGDSNDYSETEVSSMEIGYGYDLGIRFKSFSFGIGTDVGLTKYGSYMPSGEDDIELKNGTVHIDLKWSF